MSEVPADGPEQVPLINLRMGSARRQAVVQREAAERRVVGVEVALAVAHAQPLRGEPRLPLTYLREHSAQRHGERLGRVREPQVRELAIERVDGDLAQKIELAALCKEGGA